MQTQPGEMNSQAEAPRDITALLHADIRRKDWDRMHIRADRRAPAPISDAAVRCRGGRRIVVRSAMIEAV